MLHRQRTILAILAGAQRPLTRTALVKFAFLARQETALSEDLTYYDFVPYKFGPFSFALYRELEGLKRNGYVEQKMRDRLRLGPDLLAESRALIDQLPACDQTAVQKVLRKYGRLGQDRLVDYVYAQYPWYASRSERRGGNGRGVHHAPRAPLAVYTMGYEARSVDGFFDRLLHEGIVLLADVRSNPVSRKYGFSGRALAGICDKLGIKYRHFPLLGIPGAYRKALRHPSSHEQLLENYALEMLPHQGAEVAALAELVRNDPTVLVCVERDAGCCHRSKLALRVAQVCGLPIRHLA